MPLQTGARVGPYQIVGPLGAGGMGEVYRARDTKLNRDVAIKVLPEHLASDPVALARFEREAQAVAALSHPNILAIYDFGADHGVAYAVTELLEGETLSAAPGRGPAARRARPSSTRCRSSAGLAAAHEKGIVHRDLKPDNVFVTRDGRGEDPRLRAGEGRRRRRRRPRPAATRAPTPGTVMGTVGYMSPEQVRGLPRRPPHRHLLVRRHPLRDARGRRRVPRRLARRDDERDPQGGSAGVRGRRRRHSRRARSHRPPLPREGARASGSTPRTTSASRSRRYRGRRPRARRADRRASCAGEATRRACRSSWRAGRRRRRDSRRSSLGTGAGPRGRAAPEYQRLTFRRGPVFLGEARHRRQHVVYSAAWDGNRCRSSRREPRARSRMPLPFSNADVVVDFVLAASWRS